MVQKEALEESAKVTVAAVAGALASTFFADWIHHFPWWFNVPAMLVYTFFVLVVVYHFFKKK